MQRPPKASPYLTGIYAPVGGEREGAARVIQGEIPPDICGMYVQNNPNPQHPPEGAYHWFDGDGMIHGVYLENGEATYRNRYIHTRGFEAEREAGRPLWRGIMEPIDQESPLGPDKDTANTDLVVHGGKLLALWWLGGTPYEIGTPDLGTIGSVDFGGSLKMGVAAHPKVDPRSGELMFFDYSVYAEPWLRYGVASATGEVTHQTTIPLPGPRLLHDIAITAHHTIFLDFPMTWDRDAMARGRRKVGFDPATPSRFGVLKRHADGDTIRWFEAPACYAYHTINAWEEVGPQGDVEIVIYACRIENPIPTRHPSEEPDIPRLAFLRLHPFLTQWRINLTTGTVTERRLDDVPTEFPRMDDRRLGEPSRYAYAQRLAKEGTLLFDGVIRYDHQTEGAEHHSWGEGRFGGETVFVPRGEGEDEGYIMTFVNQVNDGTTDLVILDAAQVSSEPVATVRLPYRVPMGFHAHWAPKNRNTPHLGG